MLTLEQTLLYLPAVAIIIAIPGPDMVLSLSRGLTKRTSTSIAHAFGASLGNLTDSLPQTRVSGAFELPSNR